MRRMSIFPGAEPALLAPTEDALEKEMESGKSFDGCQTILTCVTNREIVVSNLVCDRGPKPSQGTCCHVNARTDSRHPRPANEL